MKLVKVASADSSNGVVLTLTMTADLKDNQLPYRPEWDEEDQTLEAAVWYGGRDSGEIKALVMYVQLWRR